MTMQDRLRFRAWYTPNYEDVKPCYVYDVEHLYDGFINNDFSDELGWASSFGTLLDSPEQFIIEQCTGLKDKNGKLIYDNDLIMIGNKLYRVAIDDFGCRTVILDNNPFKEVIEWSDIVKIYYFHNRVDEIEVVGNIRENKDLLENKDE